LWKKHHVNVENMLINTDIVWKTVDCTRKTHGKLSAYPSKADGTRLFGLYPKSPYSFHICGKNMEKIFFGMENHVENASSLVKSTSSAFLGGNGGVFIPTFSVDLSRRTQYNG